MTEVTGSEVFSAGVGEINIPRFPEHLMDTCPFPGLESRHEGMSRGCAGGHETNGPHHR